MGSWFDIKVPGILGGDKHGDKEIVILRRIVNRTKTGIHYQADSKHREQVLDYSGLGKDSRPLKSNGEKEREDGEGGSEELPKEEAKVYRGLAATLNFLSLACPDLQFGTKSAAGEMSKPRISAWQVLKKLARYLVGREAVVWEFKWQDPPSYSHTWR